MTDENSEAGEVTNGVVPDLRPKLSEGAPGGGGGGPFDLNDQQKRVLIAVLVVHVIITRFTIRDLRRRPESAVRGSKRLWRVWATLNTTGSLAYWLVGRRRGSTVSSA